MRDETIVWCIRDTKTGNTRTPWRIYKWYTNEMYPIISKKGVFDNYDEAHEAYIAEERARINQMKQTAKEAEVALDAYILEK